MTAHSSSNALASATAGATVIVSDTGSLIAALSAATSGETILVAPGTYSGVSVSHINLSGSNVVVKSEDPSNEATFTDLTVSNSTGLTFNSLNFSTIGDAPGPYGAADTNEFQILNDHNIVLSNLNVHGDPNGTLATTQSGFLIRGSQNVVLENSELSYLHYAVGQLGDIGLHIVNNYFHNIYDDGVRGGGSSVVTIQGNYFTDFHSDPTDTDHPDAIQFWTVNTTTSVRSINISDNLYIRGSGGLIQGIFVQQNNADTPYENLVIANNDFAGTGYNGIATGGGTNASIDPTITGNILEAFATGQTFISVSGAVGGTLTGNTAPQYLNSANTNIEQINEKLNVPVSDGGAALEASWMAANPAFALQFPQALANDVVKTVSTATLGAVSQFAAAMAKFAPMGGDGVGALQGTAHGDLGTALALP